jgi:hypothetical protein
MYNDHKIQIQLGVTGREVIYYDDSKVSVRWTVGGGRHTFNVTEDGESVVYEVEITPQLKFSIVPLQPAITVRRAGKIIYTDR